MENKKYVIGADIGGTTVKLGLFEEDGTLLEKWEIPTVIEGDGTAVLRDIAAEIQKCREKHNIPADGILGVGAGIPGPVTADGVVHRCVNLGWGVFDVHTALEETVGLPVVVVNDANAAAMGEAWNEKLRESGGEFGAATGRPRRVGPFDAVASRYGIRCQKAQDIALTKLDVLGAFDKIPVITGYRLHGVLLDSFPTDSRLEEAEPVIEELPGWGCDISGCRSWKDLPENARKYVCTLEKLVDHPIYLVSTGAERDAYLLRE